MEKNLYNKIVVFGASGFLGHALIENLTRNNGVVTYHNILAVGRNESQLVSLKQKFPAIQIMVGDIANPWDVKKAMHGAEQVYLLAALKHVTIAERDVQSCTRTNIIGTMNVIQESLITKPRFLVFISSDKAAQGTGVYGISKKIGEKMMEEAERINPDTAYRVVRYGNVLFSSGSVLCKWKDSILKGEEVVITEPQASRFFWPVSDAIDLIFECITMAKNAKPYIMPMKSMQIGDLLEAMLEKYGRVPVRTIGLQPGENMHEIIADHLPNSAESERFTKEEIMALI